MYGSVVLLRAREACVAGAEGVTGVSRHTAALAALTAEAAATAADAEAARRSLSSFAVELYDGFQATVRVLNLYLRCCTRCSAHR